MMLTTWWWHSDAPKWGNLLLSEFTKPLGVSAGPSGRAFCWECGFKSHRGHGRLSVVSVDVSLLWVLMYLCCECCVFSGRGLCDELITRPEEYYLLWCVVEGDLETSWVRRPWELMRQIKNEVYRENCVRWRRQAPAGNCSIQGGFSTT
jgi:hypothetical protein